LISFASLISKQFGRIGAFKALWFRAERVQDFRKVS